MTFLIKGMVTFSCLLQVGGSFFIFWARELIFGINAYLKTPMGTLNIKIGDRCTCLVTRMDFFVVWRAMKLNFFLQLGFGKIHPCINFDLDRYTYRGSDVPFSVVWRGMALPIFVQAGFRIIWQMHYEISWSWPVLVLSPGHLFSGFWRAIRAKFSI